MKIVKRIFGVDACSLATMGKEKKRKEKKGKEKKRKKRRLIIVENEYNYTSIRKVGELRTLQIGSPWRSVRRESFPLGPTSHNLSTASTLSVSLSGSNSLTVTTTMVGATANANSSPLMTTLYQWKKEE